MSTDRRILCRQVGGELAKIFGIDRVVDIDMSFHLDEAARAHVTFLMNDIQAQAVVELLKSTKWGQGNE